MEGDFPPPTALPLGPGRPAPGSAFPPVSLLLSIAWRRYRNFNRLSITYAFRPRLRPRLTLSGRAFLRKPWASDGKDSHFTFATHANILSSLKSTFAYAHASTRRDCSPTTVYLNIQSIASVSDLSPVHFRRTATRPVSCYALFE